MRVNMMDYTELFNASYARLMCRGNEFGRTHCSIKDGITRAIKAGHESVLEHVIYTLEIRDISRALLQELVRHRHISLSVRSTRATLKDKETAYVNPQELSGVCIPEELTNAYDEYRETLRTFMEKNPGFPNDVLKYFIPESLETSLVLTTNARELRHMFALRAKPPALKEFNILMEKIYNVLESTGHQFMYEEYM